uniref:At1g61320/AtMIF1 LRR domain-containing protein n=1 Tax=Setaria italica TaxID=4555 RepID=K3Y3C9_SETIT
DVQCIIFSKLELKEAVRSSVLSSKWANKGMIHSKLRFDGSKMYGKYMSGKYRTLKFIDNVNRVLKLHHGKVVETLEIKQIQLSFVSFKLPSQFSGFPKLKRLDLYLLHVNRKDLQDMLSGCSNLEWLSIARCDLEDELIVDRPLSHLLYLRVAHCKMTKIELHAAKLRTFIHNGTQLPVHTIQAQELKDAEIAVTNFTTFEHALNVLPKMLARVQNLTLQVPLRLKSSSLLEKSSKFPQLRHLKLLLRHSPEDLDNILSLASFLRAAPLIEELEIHFDITGRGNAEVGRLRNLPKCPYKHLRNICISGFIGTQGQAELLVHAVENAPALEVVTIDTANKSGNSLFQDVDRRGAYIARSCLEGKISPKTKLHINNCSCEVTIR